MAVKNLLAFYDTIAGPEVRELATGDVPNINMRPISGVYYLDKNTSLPANQRNGSFTGPAKTWAELKPRIVLPGSNNAAFVYVGAGIYNETVDTIDKIYFRGYLGSRFSTLKQSSFTSSEVIVDNVRIDTGDLTLGLGIPDTSKITFINCSISNITVNYSHQPQKVTFVNSIVGNLTINGECYLHANNSAFDNVTIQNSDANVFDNNIATIQGSYKRFNGCTIGTLTSTKAIHNILVGSSLESYVNFDSSTSFDGVSYPKEITNNNTGSQRFELIRVSSVEGLNILTGFGDDPNTPIAINFPQDNLDLDTAIKDLYDFRSVVASTTFNNSDQRTVSHVAIHTTSKIFIMPHGDVGNFWISDLQEGNFTVKCDTSNNFRFDYWISNG